MQGEEVDLIEKIQGTMVFTVMNAINKDLVRPSGVKWLLVVFLMDWVCI